MQLLSFINQSHLAPFAERGLEALTDPPADVANQVYEVENYLQDRIILDPPVHDDVYCGNPRCDQPEVEDDLIFGPRYFCLDCAPAAQVDFCSSCVKLSGQGIDHDPTHRLVQLPPTACAVCQGVLRLEVRPGDTFRGLYREYSASGATLKRIAESRSCGFCAFVWNALMQSPLDDITWPPGEDEEVKIRVRRPWSNWLEIAVVSDSSAEQTDIEIRGSKFTQRSQGVSDMERELQVGPPMKWSHEMPINPLTSEEEDFRPSNIAKVQPHSGSDEALHLAKMWLENCRERHGTCNEPGSNALPTRVIDLQGGDQARVYLKETDGENGEYAALSYCWGPGGPGIITTKDNFPSHRDNGIEIKDLPQTIRDAIHAANQLGLRYLWVDRLCIIQDSPEDWTHEAALMCAVYSGATLTLSADGSNSATKGLFQADQTLSAIPYHTYKDLDGEDTPLRLLKPQSHPTLSSRASGMSQPIDQRGWTMQERLMSRRVLHFTTDEMVWECNTLIECECRRESGPSRRELSSNKINDMEAVYEHWHQVVRGYAKRSLAHESDKMPALRGLVEKFQLLMRNISEDDSQQDEYLAGLWRGDLVAELAWKPPTPADLEAFLKAANHRRVENMGETSSDDMKAWMGILRERNKSEDWHESGGYVAPSWSWAHLRGPMAYLSCFPHTPFVSYAEVLEAKTVPASPDEPTGQLSSGFITLRGHIVRGLQFNSAHGIYEDGTVKDLCWLNHDGSSHSFYIEFKPDDISGLTRKRGSTVSDVAVLLLGTKDFAPAPGGKGVIMGVSPPARMSKSKKAEDVTDTEGEELDVYGPIPDELTEVFSRDVEYARWSSFLVLVELQQEKGKYERLGCFDVWGPDDVDVIATLFFDSVKDQITII